MAKDKSKLKIFYGWWIVLASAVAHAMSGGFYFYGFSTFFLPLIKEFGWSRAAISGAFSLSRIEGGLLGPLGGFLVDRFGPRKTMILGITIAGAGFIWFSRIDSLVTFYLAFIIFVAMGTTLAMQQATIVTIANWFIKKRGMAIGLGVSGVGLGGLLLPVLAWLIAQYGWRQAATITGLIFFIIGIPLALVMRTRPEQYGYLPDGEIKEESVTQREPEVADFAPEISGTTDINFTARQALKTPVFWLLALIFGLRQLAISAVVVHQIPFLTDIGLSPELAATMLGSLALVSIVGRLGFGRMADIIEKRYVMAICLALTTIGCLILANAQTWWHIIPFLIIYSPAYGGGAALMHTLRGEYFGRRYFGTIMGFMDLVQMFGLVLGPVFAGRVFDVTGSYRLSFTVFAIATGIATVLMLFARRPVLTPKVI